MVEIHHNASFQPPLPAIRYTVRFPAPQQHYVEIEARIPANSKSELELFLPVWTPGSYLVREYSRHLEDLTAVTPERQRLPAVKTRKNRWRIAIDHPTDEVTINYLLYCNDLSVRTNFVSQEFALLHGAATFLNEVNSLYRSYAVTLELPADWRGTWSGMDRSGVTYHAPDYDALVDCPILAGSPSVYDFKVEEKPHVLLNIGDDRLWDTHRAVLDLERLVREHSALWGGLPYPSYFFFNLLTGGMGALEHRNSVVMTADRFTTRKRESYAAWLELASHEFFHVWNVKRVRPAELGPFDYENEAYTRNLWIAEGFTEYYGPLTVRRAGLITDEEFLGTSGVAGERKGCESISGLVQKLQATPGRRKHPVAESSFDAWIKLYRPDENSVNSSISYYVKGAVIAWLLDAKIRAATADAKSLDDVMRLALARYGGSRGFETEDFRLLAQEVSAIDLRRWFHEVADTTVELDYGEALAWFGLRFQPAGNSDEKAWPGFSTKISHGRLTVAQVPRFDPPGNSSSPIPEPRADAPSVSPGDEILAIDGYRVLPEQWEQRLERYRPGERISIMVVRHDRLATVSVGLGIRPETGWRVEIDPGASEEQRGHFRSWVGTRNQTPGGQQT